MVHRELTLTRGWLGAIATLLGVATLLGAATAEAANRRVAIGDYRWSLSEIHLDRGEHVTWYWVGPDTMHSVTGTSPDAAGLDSDPNESTPSHQLGDSFQLSFDRPGTYTFQCRLHSSVRGTVFVSSKPGDPVTEVDPIPRPNFDLRPPHMNDVRLQERAFGRRGTTLRLGSTRGRRSTPTTTGCGTAAEATSPAGAAGGRTWATTSTPSRPEASTSVPARAVTWRSSGRRTRATTPAPGSSASSRFASRGPAAPCRPRSPRR